MKMGTNNGHGSGQGHGHSVKDTLAGGETQRLSPSTASLSVGSSGPSMSPKSPRFPYTSRFSPKNLTNSSKSSPSQTPTTNSKSPSKSTQSQSQSHSQAGQLQTTRHPPPPHAPSAQRKAPALAPQRQQHTITPSETSTHPSLYPPYQSQPHHPHPTSQSQQQRQAHLQLQQPNSRSQDSLSPISTPTSTDSNKQPHIAELQQRLPPITRAVTASTHQQSKQHQQVERRLKSSHGRRHGDDKAGPESDSARIQNQSHKQGFFFNFSKSAKSFDRPLQSAPAQAQAQALPQSTRVAMSATDQPSIAKQSSKQSGKKRWPQTFETQNPEAKNHLPRPPFVPAGPAQMLFASLYLLSHQLPKAIGPIATINIFPMLTL